MKFEFSLYPDINDVTIRIIGELSLDETTGSLETKVSENHRAALSHNDLMEFVPDLREMIKDYNEKDGNEYQFESDYGTSMLKLKLI